MNEVEKDTVSIEEALVRTGFGRFNYFLIIFAGFVINNVYFETVGISFSLPILECDLNLTYKQQGVLVSMSFIGIILSSHLWGFLADTLGRKRVIQPSLIIGFVITVISSFSPNFETLAVTRFLNGFMISAGSAALFAYLGEFHDRKHRDLAILCSSFATAFLDILFPMLAWIVINQTWELRIPFLNIIFKPWRLFIITCGLLGFVCSFIFLYLPESPKFLLSVGKHDEALKILNNISLQNHKGKNTFNVKALLPEEDDKQNKSNTKTNAVRSFSALVWSQTAPLFNRSHLRKTVLASLLQFVIYFSAQGVLMWFPYMVNSAMQYTQNNIEPMRICDILKFTKTENFTLRDEVEKCSTTLEMDTYQHTIVNAVVYLMLFILTIFGTRTFGRKPVLFAIMLICGTCGILTPIVNIPLVSIYLIVGLLSCAIAVAVLNAIVVDIYPTSLRAMAVCITLMAGRIGSVVGSNVLGVLIDKDCELTFYCAGASVVLAGFLSFLLPTEHIY